MGNKAHKRPQKEKPATVAVGYCHPEKVSSFWHTSLVDLLNHEQQRIVSVIAVLSGPKVDSARNSIFTRWLDGTEADYLLMVDTDMVLPPDTIDRLIKHNKDIVGGLCFTGSGTLSNITPTIRVVNQDNEAAPLDVLWDYPTDSLIQVAATGGACILVKREAAEKIRVAMGENHPMPWFAHGMHNGVEIGEDISFCLRANYMGFEVWVDTSLVIPHVKPRFIAEEEYVLSLTRSDHPAHEKAGSIPIYQELIPDGSSS